MTRHQDDPFLFAKLDATIPEPLVVGKGNALFVSGWCFHRERKIVDLGIRANGAEYRILTHSMPRADVFAAYDLATDPHGNRYRSGFWAIVPFPSTEGPGSAELELTALLSNGDVAATSIGSVEIAEPIANGHLPMAHDAATGEPLIAVCMTTYNPPLDLFRAQVESLRGQTHRNWVCLVSDDSSRPDVHAAIRDELDGDDRFVLSQTEGRLGYYRNFERVLALVPAEAAFVALCDQDDRWHPDKLESLRGALESGVTLAYSDMNLIDGDGNLISPTYWTDRRTNHTDMTSLLVANTITAAATMFPRRLLDYALPFPAALGHAFHDHWLAMVALATGRIAYVDRPLYDYVQHSGNAFGSRGASWEKRGEARSSDPQSRLRGRARLSWRLLRWRLDYFYNACSARLHAEILMMRCGDALTRRKSRAVKRMTKADRSLPLAARMAVRSLGARRRRSPTMGQERLIARGIAWRRFVDLQGRIRRRRRESHGQALPTPPPPPSQSSAPPADAPKLVHQITRKITPLKLRITSTVEPRVNMLVPTIDLEHFFGAYIGKFNLARRLAERGLRVRIVAVDPTRLPDTWHDRIRRYEGLETLLDKVEVEFAPARDLLTLEVNPRDCFIATTSWTAHLAHRATAELDRERFVFVIQEYDPLTYPVGTLGAVARQAYTFPHFAVFSTELLRDYFRNHSIGVFAEGAEQGDERSVSFRNAITSVDPPSPDDMRRQAASLLFYARPEEHAERNMFELGLMAIAGAIDDGILPSGWRYHGVGAMEPSTVRITGTASMDVLPRQSQGEYRSLLRKHSVGLSLMDTPHPSLVPLEMASAGMLVVTSTFENKTYDSLRAISENLIPVEPTVDAIKGGLADAVAGIEDFDRRIQGSHVDWCRSWQESFDDALVGRIKSFVEAA